MQQSPAAGEEGPCPLIRWGCRSLEQLEPAPNTIVPERLKDDRVVPRPEASDGKDGSPRKWTPTAAASVRNALHHEGPRIQTFASATVAVRGGRRQTDWAGGQWSGPRLRGRQACAYSILVSLLRRCSISVLQTLHKCRRQLHAARPPTRVPHSSSASADRFCRTIRNRLRFEATSQHHR